MPAKTLLGEAWDKLHVMQESAAADTMPAQNPKLSKCLKYGRCICQGTGLHGRMFHENLASLLRPQWITRMKKAEREEAKRKGIKVKKTKARELAETSMLVVKLSAEVLETLPLDQHGWPDPNAEPVKSAPPDLWLHLNYINFKDLEFTFLRLLLEPEKQTLRDAIVLSVPEMLQIRKSCAVFEELMLECSWQAEWYEIIVNKEILSQTAFAPDIVEVRKLEDNVLPSMALWKCLDEEFAVGRSAQGLGGSGSGVQPPEKIPAALASGAREVRTCPQVSCLRATLATRAWMIYLNHIRPMMSHRMYRLSKLFLRLQQMTRVTAAVLTPGLQKRATKKGSTQRVGQQTWESSANGRCWLKSKSTRGLLQVVKQQRGQQAPQVLANQVGMIQRQGRLPN